MNDLLVKREALYPFYTSKVLLKYSIVIWYKVGELYFLYL